MSVKTATARTYRQRFKDKPTKALARILYNENKTLYTDAEDARTCLRRIEGKSGQKARTQLSDKSLVLEDARPYNPYKLPDSDETIYEPFVLNGHQRILLLNDIHAPYHNVAALSAAIEYGKKEKVDGVVLNGDVFDFHGLSRYLRDPRKKNFAQELRIGVEIIQTLEKVLKCKVYYKLGNHDVRYQHYLWQKLGELQGVEDFEFREILNRRLPNVEIIDDKTIIKAGALNIVHGHEFGGSVFSPVNIARGFYLRAKASTIGGHHHRTSEHTEIDINGKITTTWSVGSLCELHPAYLPINSWNHGCAVVDIDGDEFLVRNKRIYKGKVY